MYSAVITSVKDSNSDQRLSRTFMERNRVWYLLHTSLFWKCLALFTGIYVCQGLSTNGTRSRRFVTDSYADGPLCVVGERIAVRDSYYAVSSSLDEDRNASASDAAECRRKVATVHEDVMKSCENRIACDDLMVPAQSVQCDGELLDADYLRIEYDCVNVNKTVGRQRYGLTCKDKGQQTLHCEDNEIVVKDLLVGYKKAGSACVYEVEWDDCLIHYSSERLGNDSLNDQYDFVERCSGQPSCTVTPADFRTTNVTCGSELRDAANDYILAIYECSVVNHAKTVENGDEVDISCSADNLIRITSAWFTGFVDGRSCTEDCEASSKRCRVRDWTEAYYLELLSRCDNRSACAGGLLAAPAAPPGNCYNGVFATNESRTSQALIVEYTCIPGADAYMENEPADAGSGLMYVLVGTGLFLLIVMITTVTVIFVRSRAFRNRTPKQPSKFAKISKSEQHSAALNNVERKTYARCTSLHIYAEPSAVDRNLVNKRACLEDGYREISTELADAEDDQTGVRSDVGVPGVQPEQHAYAEVRKITPRRDEVLLTDNQFYESYSAQ